MTSNEKIHRVRGWGWSWESGEEAASRKSEVTQWEFTEILGWVQDFLQGMWLSPKLFYLDIKRSLGLEGRGAWGIHIILWPWPSFTAWKSDSLATLLTSPSMFIWLVFTLVGPPFQQIQELAKISRRKGSHFKAFPSVEFPGSLVVRIRHSLSKPFPRTWKQTLPKLKVDRLSIWVSIM